MLLSKMEKIFPFTIYDTISSPKIINFLYANSHINYGKHKLKDLITEFCSDQYKIFTQLDMDNISYTFQPKVIQVLRNIDDIGIKSIIFTKSFIRLYDFVSDKSIIVGNSISVDTNHRVSNSNVVNIIEKISILAEKVEKGKFIGYYVTYKGKHFNVFCYTNIRNYRIKEIRKVLDLAHMLKSENTTIMIVFSDTISIIINKYGDKKSDDFDYIKLTIKFVTYSFDVYKLLRIINSLKTNSVIIVGHKITVFKIEPYKYTVTIYDDNVYRVDLPYCGTISFKSYKFICFKNNDYYVILLKKALLTGEEVLLATFISSEDIIFKFKKILNRIPKGYYLVLYHYRESIIIEYNSSFIDLFSGIPFSLLLKNSKCNVFGLNKNIIEEELYNIVKSMKCKQFNIRINEYKYL